MRRTIVLGLLLVAGCGPSLPAEPSRSGCVPGGIDVRVADGERLTDPDSRAIEGAIAGRLGFPLRVVARVDLGEEQLVLYAMNALAHWLAEHPERQGLASALEECEPEDDDYAQCIDYALRPAREPGLWAEHLRDCRARNQGGDVANVETMCRELFETEVAFDVDAYCDGGYWIVARRAGDAWALGPARRVPERCLTRVLAVRAVDLDADGAPEILLDAIDSSYDAMTLVNELDVRVVSVYRHTGNALARTFAIEMGTYAANLGSLDELRCTYSLVGGRRPSFRRECCEEQLAEEEGDEDLEPRYSVTLGQACGRRWVETFAPSGPAGFEVCRTVVARESVLRERPSDTATEIEYGGEISIGRTLRVVSAQGEWLEVLSPELDVPGTGWLRESDTERRCASPNDAL